MRARFAEGDAVQTPFGKGVVREVRNNGRLLVDIRGRPWEVRESDAAPLDPKLVDGPLRPSPGAGSLERVERRRGPGGPLHAVEVDLHGLAVAEALAHVESALNDALLRDATELRVIHGKSGGRIRGALHQRLREIPGIRGFHLDPTNEGVTIVRF